MRLYVIFELILCSIHILYSGTNTLMYKMSLVHLCIKPRQTCQHLEAVSYMKLYKALNCFLLPDELQRKLWQMHFHSSDFTFLPFINNMDVSLHTIYMSIAIRDDLKFYSTSKHIQSDGNETDQEAFTQTSEIKSEIHEDVLQTSDTPKQSSEKSTITKSGDSKGKITTTNVRTRQTQKGRYREAKTLSNLFAAHDALQEIMYLQLDDLTTKDVFLSSILKWAFSKEDKEQQITQLKDTGMFDFVFFMKCDQGPLCHDIHSAIQSNMYSNIPTLQDLANQAIVNENCKCLLVIDVPDELHLELKIALRTNFGLTFPNCTIMTISPFIDMAKIKGTLGEQEKVVHVYKKDKHDISEMIKESMKSKAKSTDNVLNQITNDNINDIRWERFSNDPFLLSLLLFSQQTPNVDDSITQFIINVIDHLLQNGFKNGTLSVNSLKQFLVDTPRNETLQRFINKYETVSKYLPILLTLGSIAFQNLTGKHKIKESSNGLHEYRKRAAIGVGVEVGLLRKTANESPIEFLHDIFQDMFAALWTVEREMFKEFVDTSLTSLQHMLSYAQYLTFLVGLDPKLGPIIAQHMVVLCNKDDRISEYRQTLGVSPVVAEMNNIWKRISMEASHIDRNCPDQHSILVLSDVLQAYQNKYSKLDHLTHAMKEAIISFYLDDATMEWRSYSGSEVFVTFLQQCSNIQKLALTCEALDIFQKKGTNNLLPSLLVLHVQGEWSCSRMSVDWLVLKNVTSLSFYGIKFSSNDDKRRVERYIESLQSLKELQLKKIDSKEEMNIRVSSHLKALTLKNVSLAEIDIQIVSSLELIVIHSLKCRHRVVLKMIQETKILKECDIDFPKTELDTDIQILHCKFLKRLCLFSSYTKVIRLTLISEILPHLTVCNLHNISIDDSVCRVLETALHAASSLEVLKIYSIKTEWMSLDLCNSMKLRSLTIRNCPVVQIIFCTISLEILDIGLSNKLANPTKHLLNTETEIIHGKHKDVGCMTIKDEYVSLDISNSSTLKVLELNFLGGLILWDIHINVDQLETITIQNVRLESASCAQMENIVKRTRKVKYFTLSVQTSDRIPRVNLMNCIYLQSLDITNITNVSICPWNIRTQRLQNNSIRSLYSEDRVSVSDQNELLDLNCFPRLESLVLDRVDLGDNGFLLTYYNVRVNEVILKDVRMSLSGWFTFVQSLLNVKGRIYVGIMAWDADIPDEILNIIMSLTVFRISCMEVKDTGYKTLEFEKLERPGLRRHRHRCRGEHMLPRVVEPVKPHGAILSASEGMKMFTTRHSLQGEVFKKLSDSEVMKVVSEKPYKVRRSIQGELMKKRESDSDVMQSIKPVHVSEKHYKAGKSLQGELIKKSKSGVMKFKTPETEEEV